MAVLATAAAAVALVAALPVTLHRAQYTGDLTWYDTGLGACGWTSGASDSIVAVSQALFDEYTPNDGNPNGESRSAEIAISITWNAVR